MAIVANVDLFIMGATGGGLAACARAINLGLTVAIGDETALPGGLLVGGLGLIDYVGVGTSTDTLSGYGRKFFLDCEVAAIADGAVVGNAADDTVTPPIAAVDGYGRQYTDLPRRIAPEWGRYARDKMLAGAQKFWDIEIASIEVPSDRIGTIVTFTDGRQIQAKNFLSCSYEGTLSRAARVPFTHGRSENRATYNEELAGAFSNNRLIDAAATLNSKGDICRGYQGVSPQKPGEGDLRAMAFNWRMTLSKHANRLPFLPPPNFREADFEDWINERGSKYTTIEGIASGQMMSAHLMTTNGGSQWGYPREYARCTTKAQRQAFWARHYYFMAGWYYLAQNSSRVNPALKANMALWGLPHDHNITEFYGQRGWSSHLYVREDHRMHGQFKTSFENIGRSARGNTSQPAGRGGYHADSHYAIYATLPGGGAYADGDMLDDVQDGRTYWSIEFGSLKPPAGIIRNLLEVGCPSVTRTVMCSLRMEPTWMSIGEFAAVACYVATRDGVPVSEVNYAKVRALTDSLGMKV